MEERLEVGIQFVIREARRQGDSTDRISLSGVIICPSYMPDGQRLKVNSFTRNIELFLRLRMSRCQPLLAEEGSSETANPRGEVWFSYYENARYQLRTG